MLDFTLQVLLHCLQSLQIELESLFRQLTMVIIQLVFKISGNTLEFLLAITLEWQPCG